MRKMLLALATVGILAGCTNAEKGAVLGAGAGAGVGLLAGGNDVRNAAIGAGVGALAGYLIGKSVDKQGYCRYYDYDKYGRRYEYEAPCR
jgi:hypothetical protein